MKALSIHQPWATLIATELKEYETRSWETSHRGELAICATRATDQRYQDIAHGHPAAGDLAGFGFESFGDLPLGAVVAVADLIDCRWTGPHGAPAAWVRSLHWREKSYGDFRPCRYGWRLAGIRRLPKPVPVRGQQGLYDLPPSVEAMVRLQLEQLRRPA